MPAVGALLALSAALAAACFVKAFGVTFLGRARTPAAAHARETDRFSLAAMFFFAALCLVAGILPGLFIDALAPVVQSLVGDAHAGADAASSGCRSCRSPKAAAPITACWSSCSCCCRARSRPGQFIAWRPTSCAAARPGTAAIPTRAPRRNTPRRASRSRSAACSARVVFRAREHVDMPPPGDLRPARLTRRAARSGLGLRSTRRSPAASASPPIGSITCSS